MENEKGEWEEWGWRMGMEDGEWVRDRPND